MTVGPVKTQRPAPVVQHEREVLAQPEVAPQEIAGGVAKQAAAKGIAKAAVSLISKAAAPETAGLSLVVGQVVGWIADKINWKELKKWSAAIIGVLAFLVALPFGIGAAIGAGILTTGISMGLGAGMGNITLGSIGSGIFSIFGAIGDELAKAGHAVDKRKIEMEHPIKQLGEHTVPVRLHSDIHASVRVTVVQA